MTTRRGFLKGAGAAGMMFCGCGLLDAARAQQTAARHTLPVMVNGKRVKTIDVHCHCLFHESLALMGDQAARVRPKTKGADQMFIATPAIAGGSIYLRGPETLYCIRQQ